MPRMIIRSFGTSLLSVLPVGLRDATTQLAYEVSDALGAPLITYDGTQHTVVFDGNQCVDGAVIRYLVDGMPPLASLSCQS